MKSTRQQIPGLVLFEHEFELPLDHGNPGGETIQVFAREVTTPKQEAKDLPRLLYLQGGPGFPAGRPLDASGWLGEALKDFRVVLLDQRGTGRSTPVTHETLEVKGAGEGMANYLRNFRSDSIVQDAECIRRELLGEDGKWTLLGQSYGGFCSVHYLSVAPDSLDAVLVTGGLPGISASTEDIYRLTYAKLIEKNRKYYARYPGDVERIRAIASYLAENEVILRGGSRLSVRGFQTLGISFGMSDGFEPLHYLVESAFVEGPRGKQLSYAFLRGVQSYTNYDTNPIYAIMHEAIYSQGAATAWCASRLRSEFPEFDAADGPLFFTSEMIFPWMFEEIQELRGLRESADLLAADSSWGELYDLERLAANTVPVAAAAYYDDVYVPIDLSLDSASRIPNVKVWVTNEYEHNGLRADGKRILRRLLDMVHGNI